MKVSRYSYELEILIKKEAFYKKPENRLCIDVIFPFFQLWTENIRVDFDGMGRFLQICVSSLDEFAPQRNKYFRGNNKLFIKKVKKKLLLKEVVWETVNSKAAQITLSFHTTSKDMF